MTILLPKVIVILGPTASGKTDLAIQLAQRFNGEIISADSRQVYTKMIIGTAQPVGTWETVNGVRVYVVQGVRHHLVNCVDPGEEMSVAEFKKIALATIYDIVKRGKIPLVVGGTGLYTSALVDNLEIPHIPPNKKLRQGLEQKTLAELVTLLTQLDPEAAIRIDIKNSRRVIRALEVALLSGESFTKQQRRGEPCVAALQIGIRWPTAELKKRINERIEAQVKAGLLPETEALVRQKYGWNLPSMSSIGYREMGMYLHGECTWDEAVMKLKTATYHYAKRQLTWFKRDKRIVWISGGDYVAAEKLVAEFLEPRNIEIF